MKKGAKLFTAILILILIVSALSLSACSNLQPENNIATEAAYQTEEIISNVNPTPSSLPPAETSSNSSMAPAQEVPVFTTLDTLRVHFIDVGQGDSVLIQAGSHAMLIDAGENNKGDLVVSYIKNLGIEKLDFVVGTHPHSDHIGGLDTVLNSIHTENVIIPNIEHTTKTFEDFIDAIIENNINAIQPVVGTTYSLGGATFTIVAPSSLHYDKMNNYSVGLKLTFGSTRFLFVGDAETPSENEMLTCGIDISADVIKIGHHGSNSSTSSAFLRAVDPDSAVICVGKDNSYGHPTPGTLHKLSDKGIAVYMTSTDGNIVATSDGNSINFDKTPTADTVSTIVPNPTDNSSGSDDQIIYIGNRNSKNFHLPTCHTLPAEKNRVFFSRREEAISSGYDPCGNCNP